jgi:hypothetical protein
MIFDKGWLFRLGISMKDFGERHPWLSLGIIKPLGLRLKDWVLTHSTVEDLYRGKCQRCDKAAGKMKG